MSADDRRRWDAKYAQKSDLCKFAPDEWLMTQAESLPAGRAIELACGVGHNAIWLAERGWSVDAVDISPAGLTIAAKLAAQEKVEVNWIAADLDEYVPGENSYDLVAVFRFLERTRIPRLIERALRPGGVLVYETFTVAHLARPDSPMKNPAFALSRDELPRLFPGLELVSYAELDLADRSVARLVGRKRE